MNIIFKLLICVLLVLLSYVLFKSEIIYNGTKREYYQPYIIINIISLLITYVFLKLEKKFQEYFLIILSGIIFSFYSFETYLTWKGGWKNDKRLRAKLSMENGKNFDLRSRLQFLIDLRETKQKAYISIRPYNYISTGKLNIFPLSGISNSMTVYGNEGGNYFSYISDRYGFNNPDNEWDSNQFEYVLIGDSYTHGASVNRPHDIASVLRRLSSKNVLNLGMAGNGPLIELATLKEYLPNKVNKVLWLYYEGNDLKDLKNEMNNKILRKYFSEKKFSQNLKKKQKSIDKINIALHEKKVLERSNEESLKFKVTRFLKFFFTRQLITDSLKEKEYVDEQNFKLDNFLRIIDNVETITRDKKIDFYFVYIPEYYRYKFDFKEDAYNKLKSEILKKNIKFIDLHEFIKKNVENPLILYPFSLKGHFNEYGYNLITKYIYNFTN